MKNNNNTATKYPETEIPIFWPSAFFLGLRKMKIETLEWECERKLRLEMEE